MDHQDTQKPTSNTVAVADVSPNSELLAAEPQIGRIVWNKISRPAHGPGWSSIPPERQVAVDIDWVLQPVTQDLDNQAKRVAVLAKWYLVASTNKHHRLPLPVAIQRNSIEYSSSTSYDHWTPISPGEDILLEIHWTDDVDPHESNDPGLRLQIRWCTANGIKNEDGVRPWQEAWRGQYIEGDDVLFDESAGWIPKSAVDPLSMEGQKPGAILLVMRTPEFIRDSEGTQFKKVENMQVGDFVKIVSHSGNECQVLNLRTGAKGVVPWNTFLAVGEREVCVCFRQRCRCVYLE
ncbi:uncharacterized protein BP5553_03070 [Venustampulla echinocandica]|uniref:Uncharacterized protein n=1 Tax=Venustampulla echinocandica TaxID=2656787 RepID=A0A370TT67_9HELO|nr:uncharacterized protein BP5553_03070 [Venustampulla echinocandica]RDL38730.1 hypothetical protein BP5553_03070 [Venustampulla echinocandica]